MAKIWSYTIIFYSRKTLNHLQKPIWDYVIEGSNFFFQLTYLPNPQSGILMLKPPQCWVNGEGLLQAAESVCGELQQQ